MHRELDTTICIVGGGPSGLLLGLLLAKQGIHVTLLESQPNFERKFRGEVLQPRFIRLMKQLGLDQHLNQYEHIKLSTGEIWSEEKMIASIDYAKDTPEAPFSVRMKQSVLLQALYDEAVKYDHFQMFFNARVKSLIKERGSINGVVALIEKQETRIHAHLTVGADGRFSTVRKQGDFTYKYKIHDFDVIWFTVPVSEDRDKDIFFRVTHFRNFIVIPSSNDVLQIGFTVRKGEWEGIKKRGLDALSDELIRVFPDLQEQLRKITDFQSFVTVKADVFFVEQWYRKGCVLIGDAAHCSSPVGAIGISLAAETAAVLAQLIHQSVQDDDFEFREVERITALRAKEVMMVHRMQGAVTKAIIKAPKWVKKGTIIASPLLSKTKLFQLAKRKFLLGKMSAPSEKSKGNPTAY